MLTEEINTSKALVGDLLKILRSDSRLLDSERDEMVIGTGAHKAVTRKAVEYLLIGMDVLERNMDQNY